jgi:ABC-type branched-subunit amino acid transport system substrate-binding protein
MADDLDLSRAAAPLPLPGGLRERLRALVLAGTSEETELAAALAVAAAPAPLPAAVRAGLEGMVRRRAGAPRLVPGLPIPPIRIGGDSGLRAALERTLRAAARGWAAPAGAARPDPAASAARRLATGPGSPRSDRAAAGNRRRWGGLVDRLGPGSVAAGLDRHPAAARALAASLVLALLAGTTVGVLSLRHPQPAHRGGGQTLPGGNGGVAVAPSRPPAPPSGLAQSPGGGPSARPGRPGASPGASPGPGLAIVAPYGPPPFSAPANLASTGGPEPSPTVAQPVPAHIAVAAAADPEERAGFDAYMALIARQGGVGDRTVEVTPADAGHPASGVLATVNLGAFPIATGAGLPAWASAPLLETLAVDSGTLHRQDVFDASSPADRQAHLVADHLLSDTDLKSRPAPTVVIYRTQDGVFAQEVPNAVAAVLQGAGIQVVTQDYTPGAFRPVPADAAVLSMPTAAARQLLGEATCPICTPRLGFTGLYSLYDGSLAAALPDGSTLISPYWPASPSEANAIAAAARSAGVPVGAGMLHGWATAKEIAVALYYADPLDPQAMTQALASLPPDATGLAPIHLRQGDHERYPEGLLLKLGGGAFQAASAFRTDSH